MLKCATALQAKNPNMQHLHFDHLNGLHATDALVEKLLAIGLVSQPPAKVVRWRQRLQDALIDSHFSLGQTKITVALEPDHGIGIVQALQEAGARCSGFISSVKAQHLATMENVTPLVGDMEDMEALHPTTDLFISNFHAERIAHRHGKALMLRGFPNWEQVGNTLKNDVLYEGSCYLLFESANLATEQRAKADH
jgi:nitrogenase molybdenum-iron protein NifN